MANNLQTFTKDLGTKPKSSPSRLRKWNSTIQKYKTLEHKETQIRNQESMTNINNLKHEISKLEEQNER